MQSARRIRGIVAALASSAFLLAPISARASHTPNPSSVTVAGSLDTALGCAGDWDPSCAAAHLVYDANDDVWQGTWTLPAGGYEYKAALDNSWTENYGAHAAAGGANIPLSLATSSAVKFYYSHRTHWITDDQGAVIVTAAGSFQSELGCSGDWDPSCLRSWLQDPDGDGVYTMETTALPPGAYEAKAAIREGWSENYGAGGQPGGANIPFSVFAAGQRVRFSYVASSHLLTIAADHGLDNNVEWNGLGHDSQDLAWRQPFGAVVAGTEVVLRFRTFRGDVSSVKLRVWDAAASAETILPMSVVASGECLSPALAAEECDWWETRVRPATPTTLYYRFIVSDGTSTAYYSDDPMLDGGWGRASASAVDDSYAITVHAAGFQPIAWMRDAVVYQIFPDRFANGRKDNDASTSEPRYAYPPSVDDQIVRKAWGALPEGYCRNYVASTCNEGPRGRDYFGGDLKGIDQHLSDLRAIGVNTLYLNPIFESASNHGYDTRDYQRVDHRFGTQKDWENLEKHARELGIRIVLDGVFNHVSSDSMYFDRDRHFAAVGACESTASPYRDWFTFTPSSTGPCAGPADYQSWFGFGSLPVLDKTNSGVRSLFFAGANPVATSWLKAGADGWRLDVMGDPSFPVAFWRDFRGVVKAGYPQAPIIGELWKKGDVLPLVRGDTADTTMNYRFRNAVTGFLGCIDHKGFADDGACRQAPSVFANKILSTREDYPDATWFTALNLLDSHDTERILWSLTPGVANREAKEWNAANLAIGKARLRLAVALQMTLPGAPTVYYGDEVGLTGADDPDCRRTMPWSSTNAPAGDLSLRSWYARLAAIRAANPVLRGGDLQFLVADDANRTLAFARAQGNAFAVVVVNGDDSVAHAVDVPLDGVLRDGVAFTDVIGGGRYTSSAGRISLSLAGAAAAVLLADPGQDLTAPAAPTGLRVTSEGNGSVSLAWNASAGASGYHVYRSFLSGGGWSRVTASPVPATSFDDSGLANATPYFYVVTALDALGNEGAVSAEVKAVPHLAIGWANLQWPPTLTHTISAVARTDNVYGQVWIDGETRNPGATPTLGAQLGFGPQGTSPGLPSWSWVDASFNVDSGNNDEFKASLLPDATGVFDYVYRYTTDGARTWLYADLSGPVSGGTLPANPGKLTVLASSDTTPPSAPAGLRVVGASTTFIELAWDAVAGDPTLYGYEVLRKSGGAFAVVALTTATTFTDFDVTSGASYVYVVRSVDSSFNRSGYGSEVSATAAPRKVTVTWNVTVPATTDATALSVYIAGTLSRLDGGHPDWDPGAVALSRVDATHWTVTLTGAEDVQLEYKYALGSWTYVEKDGSCGEVANRALTLTYGASGTQTVNDTVLNWRNVAPCGD